MKKAFTLIELLVVISIVALLLAILTPGLNSAKQMAQGAVCLTNSHTLSLAWYQYASENDDCMVGGYTGESANPGYSWVQIPQDEYNGQTVWNSTVEQELCGIRAGLLWDYVENEEAYHCPGDKRFQKPPTVHYEGVDGGYRSYSIAGGMFGWPEESVTSDSPNWAQLFPYKRFSEVRSPDSKYVFVEEADGRGFNHSAWVIYPEEMNDKEWIDPIAIWHKNSSILGFADGHAERHKWVDPDTIEMAEQQITFFRDPDSRDLEYMQKGYGYRRLLQ